jgi:hypothetical protein
MSRYLASLLCAALFCLSPAVATEGVSQEVDLTGEWELTVQSPNGSGTRTLTLVQVGDSLSGTVSSSRASGELEGVVEGDRLTFTALLVMQGGMFPVTYRATFTDEEMEGTVDFGDYGSGTFTGRRVKPPTVSDSDRPIRQPASSASISPTSRSSDSSKAVRSVAENSV